MFIVIVAAYSEAGGLRYNSANIKPDSGWSSGC